jgi:hypothetical protein
MDFMKAKVFGVQSTEKLLAAGALVAAAAAVWILFAATILPAQTRQEEVAKRGTQVMPFDLEQTTHVFQNVEGRRAAESGR